MGFRLRPGFSGDINLSVGPGCPAMSDEGTLRADVLTEFLELAVNAILYTRNIYPREIFALKKKYQIPVRVSKHPKVNEYLMRCLKTVRYLLETDSVRDVSVAILSDDEILEKYVFSVRLTGETIPDDYLVSVEEMFRQFILKLTAVDGRLGRLPPDATFAFHVTTNEQCYVRLNETVDGSDFPWIETEETERSNPLHRIIPIKSSECSLFSLNAYVES